MKFHDFTDAELQAMAQNCEVRFDLPRTTREPYQLPPGLGARMHLSEAEQQRVSAEVDKVSREVVAHLRAFYLEATGDAAGADALEPQSLMQEILESRRQRRCGRRTRRSRASGRAFPLRRRAASPSATCAT
jgi:hypothetical protein